jgi:hypothetical protein
MKDEIDDARIKMAHRLTILAVAAWLVAASVAGALGIVNEPGRPPLVLAGFLTLPILGFVAAYRTSASFRAFAERIPMTVLVGSHLWRFVGIGFVAAWLAGALPAGFGIPEGFGDIAAAVGALILLPMLRRGTASRGWLLAWNTFGFLDESRLGVLSAPGSNTTLMITFPVSLIPTFFVPLFLLVHALTFRRIAGMKAAAALEARGVKPPGVSFRARRARNPELFRFGADSAETGIPRRRSG